MSLVWAETLGMVLFRAVKVDQFLEAIINVAHVVNVGGPVVRHGLLGGN